MKWSFFYNATQNRKLFRRIKSGREMIWWRLKHKSHFLSLCFCYIYTWSDVQYCLFSRKLLNFVYTIGPVFLSPKEVSGIFFIFHKTICSIEVVRGRPNVPANRSNLSLVPFCHLAFGGRRAEPVGAVGARERGASRRVRSTTFLTGPRLIR